MPSIEQVLREALAPQEVVEFVVLFGSAVANRMTAGSDVDLGIRWNARTGVEHRAELLSALERSLGRTIDVVDVDSAPPQLCFEIARGGKLIVERQTGAWSAFRAKAFIEWWDFRPLARRIHLAHISRLRGSVHGSR